MKLSRLRVPLGLPISIVVLLALGLLAGPFIEARTTEEQLAQNVLLSAIPFILVFVAIVLAYITVIVMAASVLDGNVGRGVYRSIELGLIGGIALGIIGMFQPWIFGLYKIGFLILLAATLGYILWSHITPVGVRRRESMGGVSVGELEGGGTD